MKLPNGPAARMTGLILCRFIVPLWILTGAMVKMIEATPTLLPKGTIFDTVIKGWGVDGFLLLSALVALELMAVALILFVAKLARPLAIFMLSCFVLILLNEIRLGNADCGCFGSNSPNIWVMLGIDAALLVGCVLFKPGVVKWATQSPKWAMPAAAVLTVIGAVASFAVVLTSSKTNGTEVAGGSGGATDPGTPGWSAPIGGYTGTTNPDPKPLPERGLWFTKDIEQWIGQSWSDIELFQFMETFPRDMDGDLKYVVFYRRSCDHCEEMFLTDLWDEELQKKLTVVEIPETPTEMRGDDPFELNEADYEHIEFIQHRMGCDWFITTPLVLVLGNGEIECVNEGDHAPCLFPEN